MNDQTKQKVEEDASGLSRSTVGLGSTFELPEFEYWMADKEAEYQMNGFTKKESKEKAMSDWHTYMTPNVEVTGWPTTNRTKEIKHDRTTKRNRSR